MYSAQKDKKSMADKIMNDRASLRKTRQVRVWLRKAMSGASILWECLEREGVTSVFGYPEGRFCRRMTR